MSRMVGGTFGVAALGALIASVGSADLERSLPNVTDSARERIVDGLGSGAAASGVPEQVHAAANHAFVDALSAGLEVSAIAAFVGALLAWALIHNRRPGLPAEQQAEVAGAVQAAPAGA
jgi:hypothetical protein